MTRCRFQAGLVIVMACCAVGRVASGTSGSAAAQPTLFWASDPVRPGEAVVVTGHGLVPGCVVELFRLADDSPGSEPQMIHWPANIVKPEVLQPRGHSLKFVLPADWAPGVVALRIRSGEAVSETKLLNCPETWWRQGNIGTRATPGGTVRIFGRNLGWNHGTGTSKDSPAATVALSGTKPVVLAARGDCYNLTVDLPANMPLGDYQLVAHNGRGGPGAWSRPLAIKVVQQPVWPSTTLNVMDFGANGRGQQDDSKAIAEALAKLKSSGGGVLYFPRGRYLLSETMSVPERVVLRGEKRELSEIAWPDRKDALPDMIVGTHSFAIEELSFYYTNYGIAISNICEGNTSARTAGFSSVGGAYRQPNWYIQWRNNVIEEGNGYNSAHLLLPRDARLWIMGIPTKDLPCALNFGSIVRGNRLLNNASICVGSGPGPQENKDAKIPPGVQDVIVEDNFIQDNDTGIEVMPGTEGVLLRGNKFNRVVNPITPPDRLPRR